MDITTYKIQLERESMNDNIDLDNSDSTDGKVASIRPTLYTLGGNINVTHFDGSRTFLNVGISRTLESRKVHQVKAMFIQLPLNDTLQ